MEFLKRRSSALPEKSTSNPAISTFARAFARRRTTIIKDFDTGEAMSAETMFNLFSILRKHPSERQPEEILQLVKATQHIDIF
jgi:hypothetical protein